MTTNNPTSSGYEIEAINQRLQVLVASQKRGLGYVKPNPRFWDATNNQFDAESDSLRGADLIVRPDVVEMLEGMFASPLRLYTDVSKRMISDRE